MDPRAIARLVVLSFLAAMPVAAADAPAGAAPTIDDFAWLSGHWVGGEDGELIEETWGAPLGGQILGMFRQNSPRQTFYELFTLTVADDGTVELLINHFHPGLVPWEEKGLVRFTLQSWQPHRVAFVDVNGTRLIYERDGETLVGALEKDRDGTTRRFEFRYRLAPL